MALVTGASRGIGRAIALECWRPRARPSWRGARRSRAGRRGRDSAAGGAAEAVALDVTDRTAVEAVVGDVIARHGPLDILVNNAGITRDQLVLRMKREDWDAVLATNLTAAFMLHPGGAAADDSSSGPGRIINITSVVGQAGNAGQANYAASKAGLIGLTKAVALEVASRGITVNAVAPGSSTRT